MKDAAKLLEFEHAAYLRDQIKTAARKYVARTQRSNIHELVDKIIIKGAREHNLKNIDVEIPRDKLVVLTGLSGSGKSSLAFDTIYADGQRRYVESLSSYARQFLGQMEKPDVDYIEGLSPAISIDQKTTSKNPRSTVGTVTEIYDYLRLLYARIGVPHCPVCGREITPADGGPDGGPDPEAAGAAPKFRCWRRWCGARKGEHVKELEAARKAGYVRVRVDGNLYDLDEEIKLEKNKKHTIEIVVDRLVISEDIQARLAGFHGNGRWPHRRARRRRRGRRGRDDLFPELRLPGARHLASRSWRPGCSPSTTPSAPAQTAPAWAPS